MMDAPTAFCLTDIQYPYAPQSLLKNHTAYYSGHYCCPKIVHEHSVIEPTHDCNVQVSILTDWGNCTTLDKGFW